MNIYCTQEFITEFTKINKKKQYKDFENLVLNYFLKNTFDKISTGDKLYGPNEVPFIKKRLPDSSGYRIYFLSDIIAQNIYISFAHPKRPPLGFDNISTNKKKELHDFILLCRQSPDKLFKMTINPSGENILFTPY